MEARVYFPTRTGHVERFPCPGATQGPARNNDRLGCSNNDRLTQCNTKINEKAFYEPVWKDHHDILFTEKKYI